MTPIELEAMHSHCLIASAKDVITKNDVVVSLENVMMLYDELRKRVAAANTVSGGWLQIDNRFVCFLIVC